jgi:hypothetical protein
MMLSIRFGCLDSLRRRKENVNPITTIFIQNKRTSTDRQRAVVELGLYVSDKKRIGVRHFCAGYPEKWVPKARSMSFGTYADQGES